MNKIITLRGNSGSGKSTVAKILQKKLGNYVDGMQEVYSGTFLVSQDYVRREMLMVKDRPNNQAVDLLINLVTYGNQNCEYTILDGILYKEVYGNLFALIKKLYDGQIFAYYFDLPFEETFLRHRHKPISNEIGEHQLKNWWRDKDYITGINEKSIYKDMSMDDIVKLIISDITKSKDSF